MAEDYVLQTKVTADSTQFDATLKKAGKSLTAFSSEITNVTKLLGTLFVGKRIVKFAETSIDSIEKERKELNLLNTTLKTTGATAWTTQEQLVDMAQAFESESNYASEQIQRAQTVMLGFKTVTGDVFNSAMQNVLDMSEVMGMDLVSAVQTVGKALDDPVKGLGSLQRQGFAFSESQKAMLEEMVKTGRQAEAQKIILDELATTYGGAAKAGQNAFQQLDIAIGNLQKVIGENLAPVVESIATDITELINQFNSLDKGTQAFILTAGSLLTTLPLIVKGINTLKVALVSLQTSVPALLAITAGIAGISAIVGAVVKKKNEFSELSKEITKISSTTKNYLDTYSEGNEEKKLDEKATKELIKLYPELSGKVSAYTTSVEDARNAVNDLVNQKLIDAESSGIKDYIQKLNEIEKLNEKVNKLTSHKNELDEKMAKEIQNVSIPAIQKLADEERNSINERLKAIGKLLTLEGSIVEIPIELTPAKNLEVTKKSWQEALKEVLKIGDDFSTGKEAVNIYLSNMEEALKQDKRISEALGEKFDISSALKAQQEQISQVIADLLQQTDIDKPFDIEELSKESTALGSLAQAYKQMGEVISSTNQTISEESNEWTDKLLAQEIAILEKRRDNEIEWAKNAKKSEDEIYAIRADYVEKINELQVKQLNSQRDAEIKKVKNSKQSAESQKKIISQINEYYDKQIDLMNEATERFTKKSGGFLEEWGKQYEDLAGNWNKTFTDMANIGSKAMGDMFETIGKSLADDSVAYEDYTAVAVESISKVLKALSAQLSAEAAVAAAHYDYGTAAMAAAGAAAALVAAGTLSAVASNMKKISDAAKDATLSVDAFIKKLNELWSGTVTTSAFVASMSQTRKLLTETNKELDNARYKFDSLYNSLSDKGKEYFKNDWYYDFTHTTNYSSQLWYELQDRAEKFINVSEKYNETLEKMYTARKDVITEQEEGIAATNAEIAVYEELYKSLKDTSIVYENMGEIIKQNFAIIRNEMKAKLQDNLKSLYDSFSNFGKDLGEKMMNGIKEGVSTSDFMETIKDYLKEKIIALAVYTESFNDKLAEIGAKMAQAISNGTESEITKLAEEIERLYSTTSSAAKKASDVVEKSFSKINSSAMSLSEGIKNISSSINPLKIKNIQKQLEAFQEKSKEIGEGIGSKFIDSLINGTKKEDFSKELGQYFKEQFVRLTIYTEEFQEKLASYGQRLYSAIMSGSTSSIGTLKSQIDKLYSNANKSIKTMSDYIDTLFNLGEVATETESKFKIAMKSFKDSIIDLGGDVANNFVSSLSGGLNVDSALLGFKKFLRDYIIKAYVFTDSMKSEIEKIGSLIGKTLDGSISKDELSNVANAVKATYGKLADSMKTVDTLLDSVFGKETVAENVSKIQKAIDSLKDSLADLGGDVAGNFISSLNSGLDLDSALISFKKFIRNYVIQSAVYTDSLKSEMEKIGQGIADYIMGKNGGLDKISNEFKKTYEKLAGNISKADEYLDKIFGKEKVTKELSKIESAMDSFKKTVSDLGGDIASNLIDGLSNGLSQSDFLSNMKNWIKKMLVQSVVYTEQMKSQIEAIGKTISNAISGGFTETSMHEIRRDLSFIFEQATSKMSGIDKVLGGVFDGYATGTENATKGLHIVGESGPELIKFNGGERVYNNADTMRMIAGAGKTNNFNVTFNNLRDTSAFAMMNQLKQYNRELAVNGVI